MAWRNVWRNPRRSLLTMAAIAFACMLLVFMLSMQFGSYAQMINAAVRVRTGHLQVEAKGYEQEPEMRLVIPRPPEVTRLLEGRPEVAAFTPRANAFSLASAGNRTFGVLVGGIDPAGEARVSTLPSLIRQGRYLTDQDQDGAILGAILARNLQVGLGDEVTLLGQGRDGSVAATVVKVRGIYRTGLDEYDRSSLQITLANFDQVYFMRGAVHQIVVLCPSLGDVNPLAAFLRPRLAQLGGDPGLVALTWRQLLPGLMQSIEMDLVSGSIFYALLIIVVTFSILNTFLMAVLERTREFGVLMALGTGPGRLTRLLLLESTALSGLGLLTGTALGCLITWYFQVHGINMEGAAQVMEQYGLGSRMYPQLSLLTAAVGPAAVAVITFLAALYPALKVRSLRPVEALASY
ncbi:MAG: ABC transporter permease [Deltaproteobacteria bacterium]|nr:ABC transporter permease [Deltaproteobacteria bacterium]